MKAHLCSRRVAKRLTGNACDAIDDRVSGGGAGASAPSAAAPPAATADIDAWSVKLSRFSAWDDESPRCGLRAVTAKVSLSGAPFCEVEMVLVDRSPRTHVHRACDVHSSALQRLGVELFDARGVPRHPCLKAHLPAVAEGGFLYIEDLRLRAAAGGSIGKLPGALRAVLTTQPALAAKFSLVAFISDKGDEEGRAFLRAGFAQVAEFARTKGHLPTFIATHATLAAPPLSAAAVAAVEIAKYVPEVLSPANRDLQALATDAIAVDSLTGELLLRAKALLEAGASLADSRTLHFCAAHGAIECTRAFLALAPSTSAAVNARDRSGTTPLMVAAGAAVGGSRKVAYVEELLKLGADRTLVDNDGRSALGYVRNAIKGFLEFASVFGMPPLFDTTRLEVMVMPPTGPTVADDLVEI